MFFTPWAYVDHVLIQPGAAMPETRYPDMSEAYYVMSGDGSVTVDGETVAIKKGDAIPVDLNQAKSFKGGSAPLEMMIIGVAKDMKVKEAFAANPENENPERLFALIKKGKMKAANHQARLSFPSLAGNDSKRKRQHHEHPSCRHRRLLLSTTALAQTPAPQGDAPVVPNNPDYSKVIEGQPIDSRENENRRDRPAFPEQTRAPYHKTAPYKTTEITGALHAPWALAFLPDGKFLVTERLPGAFRVVSPDGTIAAPVSGP